MKIPVLFIALACAGLLLAMVIGAALGMSDGGKNRKRGRKP